MPPNMLAESQPLLLSSPVGDAETPALPNPALQSLHAMALARTIGVSARAGVFSELADGPTEVGELAHRLAFRPSLLRLMLDVLVAADLVEYDEPFHSLSPRGRRWLDPQSPTSITTYVAHTLDRWDWLTDLEAIATGRSAPNARPEDDDETSWLRFIRADYEIARLVAADVARAIGLADSARSVLDLGGGHGWYAAALCQRNPLLRATVVDEAGAVLIGREIIWETEMDHAVTHRVGNLWTEDLGGPHDAVLCQPMLADPSGPRMTLLLDRVRRVLRPGGVLAIMRPSLADAQPPAESAALALLHYLRTGSSSQTTTQQLPEQLAETGFGTPRLHRLPGAPGLCVHIARAV